METLGNSHYKFLFIWSMNAGNFVSWFTYRAETGMEEGMMAILDLVNSIRISCGKRSENLVMDIRLSFTVKGRTGWAPIFWEENWDPDKSNGFIKESDLGQAQKWNGFIFFSNHCLQPCSMASPSMTSQEDRIAVQSLSVISHSSPVQANLKQS